MKFIQLIYGNIHNDVYKEEPYFSAQPCQHEDVKRDIVGKSTEKGVIGKQASQFVISCSINAGSLKKSSVTQPLQEITIND